ncbi:hypothetical protein BFO01nite_21880 [Brevibacillus formosus]|uniref:Uncharacterized protein n=1 Tax=Brevibacillus formosus TaxID=54913 RepID=A0ABQ0T3W7_9BACL|nr:hypothetical protein BFO01nite_21880 [Brevibacillus formosus]
MYSVSLDRTIIPLQSLLLLKREVFICLNKVCKQKYDGLNNFSQIDNITWSNGEYSKGVIQVEKVERNYAGFHVNGYNEFNCIR